jgi:hypothetical protein
MKRTLVAFAILIGFGEAAECQVDTSSYNYPAGPSPLDTIGKIQQLQLQRQQIELQRLQIEQQRLQMEQSDMQLQRQLEFERQQAEIYRQRQAERAKAKK